MRPLLPYPTRRRLTFPVLFLSGTVSKAFLVKRQHNFNCVQHNLWVKKSLKFIKAS